jgi:hypothetical protein
MTLSLSELLLLIIVIAGAAYAGYMLGRRSALAEQRRGTATAQADESPLPGRRESRDSYDAPPPRRSSAPPPASAGGGEPGGGFSGSAPPRRSSAPPPARAGLLDPDGGKKR